MPVAGNSSRPPGGCGRRSQLLLRYLAVAIAAVVSLHWHLVVAHLRSADGSGGTAAAWMRTPSSSGAGSVRRGRTGRERKRGGGRGGGAQGGRAGGRLGGQRRRPRYSDAPHTTGGSSSPPPYESSLICRGCSRAKFRQRGENKCADVVRQRGRRDNSGGEWAAALALAGKIEACRPCDPVACYEGAWAAAANLTGADEGGNSSLPPITNFRTKYWRFDHAAPSFSAGSIPKSLVLPSVPSDLRVPPDRFADVFAYIREKHVSNPAGDFDDGMDFLFEYNPGLVRLPPKAKESLPPDAEYLLSLRVTPANNCFAEKGYANLGQELWDAVYRTTKNHLGLALLDKNLNVLPGYDVVIKLDSQLGLETDISTGKGGVPFMDYRLFVLGGDDDDSGERGAGAEIYLHVNADTVVVAPIRLSAKGYGDDDLWKKERGSIDQRLQRFLELKQPLPLENLYGGDNFRVSLLHDFNTVWSGGIFGKNYALFEAFDDEGGGDGDGAMEKKSVYAEVSISPSHVTQRIIPDEYDLLPLRQVFGYIWNQGTGKMRNNSIDRINQRSVVTPPDVNRSRYDSGATAPRPSFSTVDELWFPGDDIFKKDAHGGACCIPFSRDELGMDDVMYDGGMVEGEMFHVGVAHTKVPYKRHYTNGKMSQAEKEARPHTHYVTFFYAFRPVPPFELIARSGYFCLGFGDGPDESASNPRAKLGRDRMLMQNNEKFDCPQIHYVSAFVEKAGDPTRTVLGYGINDCTARLVEVDKAEIGRMLFPDPMEMVFDVVK